MLAVTQPKYIMYRILELCKEARRTTEFPQHQSSVIGPRENQFDLQGHLIPHPIQMLSQQDLQLPRQAQVDQ